jgi:signal transduction histidine kinase
VVIRIVTGRVGTLSFNKPNPQTRFQLESLGLFIASCLFIGASHFGGWFTSLDRIIYDAVISRLEAPKAADIVVVGIDDRSLHQFGPWPWSRQLQADLLTAVNQQAPKAVVMDIIYSGEHPDNEQLVQSASEVTTLGLPMMIDSLGQGQQHVEVLPFPNLLQITDVVGHVQVERDDDAIVRGTYLYQGVGSPHWPHITVALAEYIHDVVPAACSNSSSGPNFSKTPSPLHIQKCGYIRFPFAGPPGSYDQVSAAHLLNAGAAPPAALHGALNDKIVLVGITAMGGSDWVTSPLGSETSPLSGVEFNANLLSALLLNTKILKTPDWLVVVLGILLTGFSTLLLPRLRPKQALATSLIVAVLPVAITMALLPLLWVHLPLANVTIAALLIYPLWSWRRHEIAWSFIQSELSRIDGEEEKWQLKRSPKAQSDIHRSLQLLLNAHITMPNSSNDAALVHRELPLTQTEQELLNNQLKALDGKEPVDALPAERLARQISQLESRGRHLREGRDIGLLGLDRMSSGAIIITDLGDVRFINKTAGQMLGWKDDVDLMKQLQQITTPLGQNWRDIWRSAVLDKRTVSFESRLNEKPIFLSAAPLETSRDQATTTAWASSWVLTLSDLSDIREAEAHREEALAFLSHDLRSPLASILALLQQVDEDKRDVPLLNEIFKYTQKGLATSDQFLQLSRLQLHPSFETYSLDLEQLIHNSIEQVFFLAKEKCIDISLAESGLEDGVWIEGNGELLERALVNLLGNAIKYSNDGTATTLRLRVIADTATINISDHGYGIPEDELQHIFEPFFRSAEPRLAQNRGAGLGLRFVKTVVERHGGDISATSQWGQGTNFQIRIPLSS